MKLLVIAGLALGFTASISAEDEPPKFLFPVDCVLGQNCWIARYMDRAAGTAKADYACQSKTQDKHNGTDIALADVGVMQAGVAVKAAAAGRVIALRNGMPDIVVTDERSKTIQKQGCGNVLIVGHGNGWQTRYCHLKKESLLVKKGDRVSAGQVIAAVGLSGLTEFPHLHFMVQRNQRDQKIQYFDPFDGGLYEGGCIAPDNLKLQSMWAQPIADASAMVMPPIITNAQLNPEEMWQAQPQTLEASADALIIQARGFHALEGDEWHFTLVYPSGKTRELKPVRQARDRQQVRAFSGIKRPSGGFAHGLWQATVELVRGGQSLGRRETWVNVE